MFWKMLKSDLKQKKGLNVVLFLFMTVAAVLVFVSSVQVYEFFTGNERNKEVCHISDMLIFSNDGGSPQQQYRSEYDKVLTENTHVKDYYRKEMITLETMNIDFEHFDEAKDNSFTSYTHYMTTLPKDKDLVFDLDDKPFYVENGTVYVAENLRNFTGAQAGDTLKIVTHMGNIYELKIAGFYKQPQIGRFKWYIVSDADYEFFSSEFPVTTDLYGVNVEGAAFAVSDEIVQSLWYKAPISDIEIQEFSTSDEYILGYVLSVFLALICLFLILIIVMTIRFTMIAALKEEEREIGMMRAIGVDSFRFRWLFAAKYIAFTVIGGIIGIVVGFPLSKELLIMFGSSNILPENGIITAIGIISVVFIIAIIIAFSLLVMRRINRISVMDAIRGENRGERFGKSSVMFLHKRKKMPTAFYLASSDILKRFKRYLFLFVAYTLGAVIILFAVNIKNTVISTDFLKYDMIYQMDFFIELNDEQSEQYMKRATAENKDYWTLINEDISKAGIPAHIDDDHSMSLASLVLNDTKIDMAVVYGKGDISRLAYREGGRIPQKSDEAALSYFTASRLGIQLGDTVTLSMPHYAENGLSVIYKDETFTVTSFINFMESGMPRAVLGAEYENLMDNNTWLATIIDAEGAEKEKAFAQLEELFGEAQVMTGEEFVKDNLYEYDDLFTMLEYVMGGAVLLILVLLTYLYSSIFIAEETSEIALLKSMGFTDGTIKASHIFRILILSVVSVILGEILLKTAGQVIVGQLMETLEITGFTFLPEYILSFGVVPVIIIGTVLITQWLNLKGIKNIAVWNITDE